MKYWDIFSSPTQYGDKNLRSPVPNKVKAFHKHVEFLLPFMAYRPHTDLVFLTKARNACRGYLQAAGGRESFCSAASAQAEIKGQEHLHFVYFYFFMLFGDKVNSRSIGAISPLVCLVNSCSSTYFWGCLCRTLLV